MYEHSSDLSIQHVSQPNWCWGEKNIREWQKIILEMSDEAAKGEFRAETVCVCVCVYLVKKEGFLLYPLFCAFLGDQLTQLEDLGDL